MFKWKCTSRENDWSGERIPHRHDTIGKEKFMCISFSKWYSDFESVTAQVTIWIKSEEFIIDRDFIVEYIVGHRQVSHQAPVL